MDSAQSEEHDHMEDLPYEIFARILNLVPIKQVIRCATVSRRWDAACRYIIRTRESLVIGSEAWYRKQAKLLSTGPSCRFRAVNEGQSDLLEQRPSERMDDWMDCSLGIGFDDSCDSAENKQDWDKERPSWRLDGITLADKSLAPAMMTTLNQMADLNRLSVDTSVVSPAEIIPFIRKFSQQLTMLEIDFAISVIGADAFPHLTRLRCRHFDASSSAEFPKLAELIVCGLENNERLPNMRLPSLKKLIVMDSGAGHAVKGIILANAETLTVLQMSGISLLLDRAVVFPNLMKLTCDGVDVASGCSFPALTHLLGSLVTARSLDLLPADQMLSLDVIIEGRKDAVSAISKMKNLRSLKLADQRRGEEHDTFSSIFDNMHHLEEVRLMYMIYRNEHGDRMMATLANQNPKLSRVSFFLISLTDAALTSLAQLQHLTDVSLFCLPYSDRMTTTGVLTLLRGASRNVIRRFFVFKGSVDVEQVTKEIRLMGEGRVATFGKLEMEPYNFE